MCEEPRALCCDNGLVIDNSGVCVSDAMDVSRSNAFGIPTRCVDGHFLSDDDRCKQCPEECATCYNNETCLSCGDGHYLSGTTCVKDDDLGEIWDRQMPNGIGCALCKSGFVRIGTTCTPCRDN